MELIRGRWLKKYINCWEDKRDYDILRRGYNRSRETLAADYCERFSPPELTAAEKQEILQYWAQYGIKIYDFDWHRMYYHATKVHDPRFVPDLVAGLVVYEYYNDRTYENTWRDKNMLHRLLPSVPLPNTFGRRIRGRYLHDEYGYVSDEQEPLKTFSHLVWNSIACQKNDKENMEIVIKNTRDTGFGKSVSKYSVSTEEDVEKLLAQWQNNTDYVIQQCVHQHEVMASLNTASSNVMRICSWRHGTEVDIVYAAVRVGVGNSFTDVSFADGEEHVHVVAISTDGVLADAMVDQYGQKIKKLPKDNAIPSWGRIVDIIKKNHLLVDNFDIIGWDFTVDENENPVCFEWNINWPGTVLYQFANERPLFGEKTDEILSFLKNAKNRDNYIPCYMKTK